MPTDLSLAPATDLAAGIANGTVSPVDVVDAHLQRIEARDEQLGAYITVLDEDARRLARAAERAVEDDEPLGPLHGVPVAIKDLTAFKAGVRHTFGCAAYADNVAEHTAPLVERLEDAGAIVLGKTNTPEFGHRPTTDNLLVGPTRNPFDPSKNAGGSSGGSAAAVAAGLTTLGQGGDAAGSVRVPAALCGIYGLKPSFGRIPSPARPDAFQNATPFIDKGPLTRTVADAALMLDVMAGPHPRDPFSLPERRGRFLEATERSIDGLEIAYSPDLGVFPVAERVAEIVEDAVFAFEEAGASVERVAVEHGHSLETLRKKGRKPGVQLLAAKIAANAKERDGVDFLGADRELAPEALLDRIEAGRRYSALEFERTQHVRTDVFDAVQAVFGSHDLLVTPTLGVPAVENGVLGPDEIDGEPIDRTSDWLLTWPFNLTGHPAASIPAGRTRGGHPVGMQLVGPRFADDAVLAASAAFERLQPWHDAYRRL